MAEKVKPTFFSFSFSFFPCWVSYCELHYNIAAGSTSKSDVPNVSALLCCLEFLASFGSVSLFHCELEGRKGKWSHFRPNGFSVVLYCTGTVLYSTEYWESQLLLLLHGAEGEKCKEQYVHRCKSAEFIMWICYAIFAIIFKFLALTTT